MKLDFHFTFNLRKHVKIILPRWNNNLSATHREKEKNPRGAPNKWILLRRFWWICFVIWYIEANIYRRSEASIAKWDLRAWAARKKGVGEESRSAKLNRERGVCVAGQAALRCKRWLMGIVKEMRWSAMCLESHAVPVFTANNEVSINVCMFSWNTL